MTGYTVHTGTSIKFSDGWDKVFAKAAKKKSPATKGAAKKTTAKKASASKSELARNAASLTTGQAGVCYDEAARRVIVRRERRFRDLVLEAKPLPDAPPP